MTHFNISKTFYASFNPWKVGSCKQDLSSLDISAIWKSLWLGRQISMLFGFRGTLCIRGFHSVKNIFLDRPSAIAFFQFRNMCKQCSHPQLIRFVPHDCLFFLTEAIAKSRSCWLHFPPNGNEWWHQATSLASRLAPLRLRDSGPLLSTKIQSNLPC